MIQLLNAAALLSFAALLIPLLLHLFAKKPRQKIRVGSIRFFETNTRQRRFRLAFQHVPLLIVRLMLFAFLSLLLAEPVWRSDDVTQPATVRWALIDPAVLASSNYTSRTLDSLVASGYELRWLTSGFPPFYSDVIPEVHGPANLWSLAREAAAASSSQSEFVLLTDNRLAAFRGERPAIVATRSWMMLPLQRAGRWIAEAVSTGSDSVFVVTGLSTPQRTFFQSQTTTRARLAEIRAAPALASPPDQIDNAGLALVESLAVHLSASEILTKVATPGETHIAILHDSSHAQDADYLSRALTAVYEHLRRPLQLHTQQIFEVTRLDSQAVWLFWLSSQPLDSALLRSAVDSLNVFVTAGGGTIRMVAEAIVPGVFECFERPRLRRRVAASGEGLPLWRDSRGEPLLEYLPRGRSAIFRFHSRFHPEWSELVLSSDFPRLLLHLITGEELGESPDRLENDIRRITASQVFPDSSRQTAAAAPRKTHSLHLILWLVVLLSFIGERFLAGRVMQKGSWQTE